jgi:hypothetical protein
MQEEWDQMGTDVRNLQEAMEELLVMLPQSVSFFKAENKMKKSWDKFKKSWNNFDGFISPMKAVEVKEPWNDPEFLSTWKFWKEYLQEQHGQWIKSRSEVMALKRLKEITDNNPKTAVKYLEYAMYKRNPNFYVVKEEELITNNLLNNGPEEKKPTVFKLA